MSELSNEKRNRPTIFTCLDLSKKESNEVIKNKFRTVEVKFDVNVDGILSVAAIEPASGVHERVTIHHDHK